MYGGAGQSSYYGGQGAGSYWGDSSLGSGPPGSGGSNYYQFGSPNANAGQGGIVVIEY